MILYSSFNPLKPVLHNKAKKSVDLFFNYKGILVKLFNSPLRFNLFFLISKKKYK